jgi:6-phosphogluconate dehydrogenase
MVLTIGDIAEVWRRGSAIPSWLLDLTAAGLVKEPALAQFTRRASDSGEGPWMIKAAIHQAVASRGGADYQDKLLSAMRYRFGGHLD